jgi:hypothetical protein
MPSVATTRSVTRILADDFVFTDPADRILTKAQWIADLLSGAYHFVEVRLHEPGEGARAPRLGRRRRRARPAHHRGRGPVVPRRRPQGRRPLRRRGRPLRPAHDPGALRRRRLRRLPRRAAAGARVHAREPGGGARPDPRRRPRAAEPRRPAPRPARRRHPRRAAHAPGRRLLDRGHGAARDRQRGHRGEPDADRSGAAAASEPRCGGDAAVAAARRGDRRRGARQSPVLTDDRPLLDVLALEASQHARRQHTGAFTRESLAANVALVR